MDSLVEYWEEHGALTNDDFASPQLSPFTLAQRKTRALSSATLAMDAKKTLPAFHPALAILDYIDVFGPLIFPLHRAALLRKRILLITSPPIRQACEFGTFQLCRQSLSINTDSLVYDLSIFSSTPISLANSLILPSEELVRLRPLFSVGIHDIPLLEDFAKGSALPSSILSPENDSAIAEDDDEEEEPPTQPKNIGWLACTTDEILVMKPKLYDISIEMPTSHLGHPKGRRRPVIKLAGETKEMKATQRDWRRYKTLRRALRPLMMLSSSNEDGQGDLNHENDIPLILKSFSTSEHEDVTPDDGDGVEPMTWSELAYSSFMWWASAGEKNESFIEEESQDIAMLGDLGELVRQIADSKRYTDENDEEDDVDSVEDETSNPTAMAESSQRKDARLQMEIISYFHRLTKNIFDVCSDVLSQDIDDGDINFDEGVSRVDHDALRSMGLDGWSASDREFVRSFFELWFEREVHVDPLSVECCGVRVC